MRYIVTNVTREQLKNSGVDVSGINLTHVAYCIENGVVVEFTGNLTQYLTWIKDGAKVTTLSELPFTRRYRIDEEVLVNRKNYTLNELAPIEQEIVRRKCVEMNLKSKKHTVCLYKGSLEDRWDSLREPVGKHNNGIYKLLSVDELVKLYTEVE